MLALALGLLAGPERALAQRPIGIDVSSYQGSGINWSSVKSSGRTFAWAKATEGTYYIDADFTINEANAKAAGVYIGAYHFARPDLDTGTAGADREAAYFWNEAKNYLKGGGVYLVPMLDFETSYGSGASMSAWINEWCQDIKNYAAANNAAVCNPVVYTDGSIASSLTSPATNWPLDIADPTCGNPQTTSAGVSIGPWGFWTFWQYCWSASVPGVGSCDVDVLNGNSTTLQAFLISSTATDNASYVSSSVPGTVNAGAAFTATVTMNNNGTTAWTSSGSNPYHLGTQSPQDNTTWGLSRVNLPSSPINAGQNAAFTINATAPTTPGSYTFAWKMVHDNVEWFGATFSTTITVAAIPPSITTQPANLTKNPGQTATFTVAATGTAPLSYQWQMNGVNLANGGSISGATSATLTISDVQLSDAANYSVVVSNAGGTATSQQAALTVTSTPYPTGSGIGLEGQYFNNLTLTGASLTRTDAVVNFNWGSSSPDPGVINIDQWSVRWSGQVQPLYSQIYTFYTTTDDGARLWVNGVLLIDKWVNQSSTEWSGAISLVAGQKYSLQMDYYENTGVASAELSWSRASQAKGIIPETQSYPAQPSGQNGPIPGIYNTGVDNNNVLLAAGAVDPHYQLIASADSSYPGPNSWVVNDGYPMPPWLTNGPSSKWIAPRNAQNIGNLPGNYTYRLTFNLTGLQPNAAVINGNWALDNSGVDILLNGVSTGQSNTNGFGVFSAFMITNGFLGGTNTLDFVVNNAGSTTNPTGLRVELSGVTAQAFPAAIAAPPQSQAVNQGANVTFSVVGSGTAPLSYQWQFNGASISGATGTSYTLTNVQPAEAGSYSTVVSNAWGTATSAAALLAVNVAPSITAQPQDQNANQGAGATFSVVASGTAPLSYQWRQNGVGISGATDSAYTPNNVQPADAGTYSVVVTNIAGSVTSSNAILTVNLPPLITTQPQSQTIAQGATVTFTVAATGTAPLSYQWLLNGTGIPGASDTSYTRTNAQPADAGSYAVAVINVAGVAVSSNAVLTVNSPPSISRQPVSVTVMPGGTAFFSVQVTDPFPLSYQWEFNGTNLAGATGTSFTLTNVTAANVGTYSAMVGNGFGFTASQGASLSLSTLAVSMDWNTVDGGGGVSTGGGWAFTGTSGQPDAGTLSGGAWTLQGGFWNGAIGKSPPVAYAAMFTRTANSPLTIPISSLLTNAVDPDGDPLSLVAVSAASTNGAAITMDSNSVFYAPANPDPDLTDRFDYTVSDPFGGQASGPVLISVSGGSTNAPPTITGILSLGDGNAQLNLLGSPNQWYYVQAASNLAPPVAWVTIATNQADASGVLQYTDLGATNFITRFYRFAVP